MKIFISISIATLIVFNLSAQKLKNTKFFTCEYSVPPKETKYIDAKKIYVELQNSQSFDIKKTVERKINSNYYELVGDRNQADLSVKLYSSTAIKSQRTLSEKSETKTNKKGESYVVTTFSCEGEFKCNVMVEFYDKFGLLINTKTGTLDYKVNSSNSTKIAAENDFNTNLTNAEKTNFDSEILRAFTSLEYQYLYAKEIILVTPLKFKSKKFNYDDLNGAADLVVEWIEGNNYSLESEGIGKAISIYKEALQDLDVSTKKTRINKEAGATCNYMLALIHFYAKDYPTANQYIQISEELDKRLGNSQESVKQACKTLKNRNYF